MLRDYHLFKNGAPEQCVDYVQSKQETPKQWHCFGEFIVNFWTDFTHCSDVFIIDFEQVNGCWGLTPKTVCIQSRPSKISISS